MKKVLKFFGVALAFIIGAFALVSCDNSNGNTAGGGSTPSGEGQGGTGEGTGGSGGSSQQASTYLTFIADGKIRIDIMNDNLGCTFNYGNETVVDKKEMTYGANASLGFSGTVAVDKINFVFVVEKENGTTFSVNGGILKDSLEDFLSGNAKYANAKKVYIAISTGTINWTKGLNADMDAKINTYTRGSAL